MTFFALLQRSIDRFHSLLAKIVSFFTLLMAILTSVIVGLRYGLDLGWIALQETVMYLHAAVFMLGAAMTLRENGHVRVDILYRYATPRRKAVIDLVGGLVLLMPLCGCIFIWSWDYVARAWLLQEASQAAGGLPLVFLLKTLILLFAGTLWLQALADTIRHGFTIAGRASVGPQSAADASLSNGKALGE